MDKIILSVVIAFFLSHILKLFISFEEKKTLHFFMNGGMPSTHTAIVTSLTASILLSEGFNTIFLVSLVFSLIVINDALGVRWEVSKHSKELNKINGTKRFLVVGHKPLEVVVGFIIGVLTPVVLFIIL